MVRLNQRERLRLAGDQRGDRTMASIRVNTMAFRRKHGCEPSGRYLWTFRIGTKERLYVDAHSGKAYPLFFSARDDYSTALAKAVECARTHGAADVSVSSIRYGQDNGR